MSLLLRERANELSQFCAGSEHSVGGAEIVAAAERCAATVGAADFAFTTCEAGDCCGLTVRTARGAPGDSSGDWVVVEGPSDTSHPRTILSLRDHGHSALYTAEPFDPVNNPWCTPAAIAGDYSEVPLEADALLPEGFPGMASWVVLDPAIRALVCQQPG